MTVVRFALAVLMDLAASLAHAAGFQLTEVPGDGSRPPVSGGLVSMRSAAGRGEAWTLRHVLREGFPVEGKKLPLVVMSHGRTGSFLGHRDIAETLAHAGLVATGSH